MHQKAKKIDVVQFIVYLQTHKGLLWLTIDLNYYTR